MLPTTFESHSGRSVRVARLGTGRHLILLHGYPDNLQIWSELAPLLASSFEVVAFDWPGMGYSETWPGGATPYHMAERLLTLMNAWRIDKAVVAGFDMGGQAALAFAARYPQRLDSLVVMNSLVQWDEATSIDIAILRKFGWNRLALRRFPRVVFARALRTFMSAGQTIDPALRSDMWDAFKQPQVREFIVRMCAGYEGTLRHLSQEYSSIRIPTLVLWAEQDKHFPVQQAKRLAAALPQARLEIVPRAKHWMPLSIPHEVASYFCRFISPVVDSR